MAKSGTSADSSAPVRPPRPEPRARGAATHVMGVVTEETVFVREPEADVASGAIAEAIAEVAAQPVVAVAEEATGPARAAEVSAAAADASELGTSGDDARAHVERAVLAVPIATLEGPGARVEPTPSPVPRVSLVPATGMFETAVLPTRSAASSRSAPTLVARQAPAGLVMTEGAPAVTFPPGGANSREAPIARRLARDVRSSKREILFGLGIGMALSVLLGIAGQRYLRRLQSDASVQAAETLADSTAGGGMPESETRALEPQRSALSERRPTRGGGSTGEGRESSEVASAAPAAEERPLDTARPLRAARGERAERQPAEPASVPRAFERKPARRSARSTTAASAVPASTASDPFADEVRAGPAADWADQPAHPGKASLTPAESAGLGLDLTL